MAGSFALRNLHFLLQGFLLNLAGRILRQTVHNLDDFWNFIGGQPLLAEADHLVGLQDGILSGHNHRFDNLGRVVMVGTPFQGSAPAVRLKTTRIGHFLLGKTIVQWQGVQAKDMPKDLEVGTIAGTSPIGMGRLIGRGREIRVLA